MANPVATPSSSTSGRRTCVRPSSARMAARLTAIASLLTWSAAALSATGGRESLAVALAPRAVEARKMNRAPPRGTVIGDRMTGTARTTVAGTVVAGGGHPTAATVAIGVGTTRGPPVQETREAETATGEATAVEGTGVVGIGTEGLRRTAGETGTGMEGTEMTAAAEAPGPGRGIGAVAGTRAERRRAARHTHHGSLSLGGRAEHPSQLQHAVAWLRVYCRVDDGPALHDAKETHATKNKRMGGGLGLGAWAWDARPAEIPSHSHPLPTHRARATSPRRVSSAQFEHTASLRPPLRLGNL
mmetsp:Transcript_33344/g.96640  ORF Transcript_33344/g.96640 Transcript_33344/m.96640 type:complete len:301 (-) Transcript_33344:30-932(-)